MTARDVELMDRARSSTAPTVSPFLTEQRPFRRLNHTNDPSAPVSGPPHHPSGCLARSARSVSWSPDPPERIPAFLYWVRFCPDSAAKRESTRVAAVNERPEDSARL